VYPTRADPILNDVPAQGHALPQEELQLQAVFKAWSVPTFYPVVQRWSGDSELFGQFLLVAILGCRSPPAKVFHEFFKGFLHW
jgi:hypothetical protein